MKLTRCGGYFFRRSVDFVDTNVRRGEIYYADLSPVVGSEQGGVRPVLADAAGHRASSSGRTPVYVAGDARNGSTLVVSAMSDGLACAGEVASALLR